MPDFQNVSQGAKYTNTPNLHTTCHLSSSSIFEDWLILLIVLLLSYFIIEYIVLLLSYFIIEYYLYPFQVSNRDTGRRCSCLFRVSWKSFNMSFSQFQVFYYWLLVVSCHFSIRGRSRDFEKRGCSMLVWTMIGWWRKF